MKKRFFAALLSFIMVFSLLPVNALAFGGGHGPGPGGDKPQQETTYPLYIGIYIPDSTTGTIDWPNEPCVSNKTYRFVNQGSSYSLGAPSNDSAANWKVQYAEDASMYINPTERNFQSQYNATKGADSTLGVYDNQDGIGSKGLFRDGFFSAEMQSKIVQNYLQLYVKGADASGYQLRPYVLKLETYYKQNGDVDHKEWHLDCVVLPNPSVTLSYDANLPEGVTTLPSGVNLPYNRTASGKTAIINVSNMRYDVSYTDQPVKVTVGDMTYTFAGWAEKQDATEPDYALANLVAGTAKITISKNTTLYAVWQSDKEPEPETVTITFDANGGKWTQAPAGYKLGAEDATATQSVNKNSGPYTLVDKPERDGYDFVGWYYENSLAPSLFRVGEENVTFVAHWQKKEAQTVSYSVIKHGILGDKETLTLDILNPRSASADTKVYDIIEDITTADNGVITDLDGSITYRYVATATKVNEQPLTDANCTIQNNDRIDLYYYAKTANYTIHHYLLGTTTQVADDETGTMLVGQTLTANDVTESKLYSDYKNVKAVKCEPSQSIVITKDGENVITVYYSEPAPHTYTLTYDTNGGSIADDAAYTKAGDIAVGTSLTAPAESDMTRTGYDFTGWTWYKVVEGGKDELLAETPASMPAYDLKAVAQWTAESYAITYVLDGGTNATSNPRSYVYGVGVASFADASKKGYTFDGWYTDDSFTTKFTSISTTDTDDKTLYAKWVVNPITPDLNKLGGESKAAVYKDLKISAGSDSLPSGFTATFEVTVTPELQIQSVENSVYHGSVTMTKAGSKPFNFANGKIEFTSKGTYTYTVKETIPADKDKVSGITYDEITYTLTIVVDENATGLYVKQYYVGKEAPASGNVPVTITNAYYKHTYYPRPTPTPSRPALNTADHYAYVMGYPDGTVQPGGYITRAEASTIFFRLLTDETREQYWATTNAYSDVKGGDWYNNAISTLSNAGIVSGYPDGTFRPNAPITRAEMSKIIALFAKLDKTTDRFSDIAGHWAEAYIKLAAGNGWIEGYPDGSFRPNQSITRAETVTMINRVLERVPSKESHLLPYASMLTFPDCQPGQWFYIAIQEATNSHTYERAVTEKNGDEQWTALRANRDWTLLEK